ncbi:MAG: NPCBM/NEW2 domain-containing protein [Verrucomicrobiota bacterium]
MIKGSLWAHVSGWFLAGFGSFGLMTGQEAMSSRWETSQVQVASAAREILDAYHLDSSVGGGRVLRIICWRPVDREYPPDNEERITRIMEHIRDFFADEMERLGFGRRTIQLDYQREGSLMIHHAVGSAPFADYQKSEGERVKNDCWPVLQEAGLDPDREAVLIFTNLSDWDPEKRTFAHKSPYYARGTNRSGLAWQLMSPELDTRNLERQEPIIQDGEYGRISLGKHNSIFIGGIAHELGHALGLPHCQGHEDEVSLYGTALMGSGNRTYADEIRGEGKGTFLALASALRLASHPQFSGSIKGMNFPVEALFSEWKVEAAAVGFQLSGRVTSPVPVYAVLAYLDPEERGDYDSRTVCAVPDEEGLFTLRCDQVVSGRQAEIRIFALLANGATSSWQSSYSISRDGVIDLSLISVTTELSEFVEALGSNDLGRARQLKEGLSKGSLSHEIAQSVLMAKSPDRSLIRLADPAVEEGSIALSRVKPEIEEVGWGKPAYDVLPRPDLLLVSGGRAFKTGIYAHAPARHTYRLPEEHGWKKLSGFCGLPNQRGGSVVFRVRVDGEEVYASGQVEPGRVHPLEIDLSGANLLELLVGDAGDGKVLDWGLWLDLILSR